MIKNVIPYIFVSMLSMQSNYAYDSNTSLNPNSTLNYAIKSPIPKKEEIGRRHIGDDRMIAFKINDKLKDSQFKCHIGNLSVDAIVNKELNTATCDFNIDDKNNVYFEILRKQPYILIDKRKIPILHNYELIQTKH